MRLLFTIVDVNRTIKISQLTQKLDNIDLCIKILTNVGFIKDNKTQKITLSQGDNNEEVEKIKYMLNEIKMNTNNVEEEEEANNNDSFLEDMDVN